MKKKIVLLLSFVLAFTLALGILAVGCKKTKKEDVVVTISKTTLEVVVGKTGTLTAAASDGSELVWTTDNADVATVDNGKVTGKKAGTANIKATVKDGEASASCAVTVIDATTFAFTVDGEAVTEITVDRNGDPVQLAVTASDGSDITGWSTDIPDCLSIVNGLVTGLKEGTGKITVTTSSKAVGEIAVTVIDTYDGVHYQITDEQAEGEWYYWTRTDKGQTWEVSGEVRGDLITFKYDGGNWDVDSIYLAVKNPDVANGWRRLSMTINSDIETVITVNGTRVDLVEGENKISVCYQQTAADSATLSFSNGEANTKPTAMEISITDVKWEAFTPVDLVIPEFKLEDDGTLTIMDEENEEGVSNYEIGLFFENGSPFSVYNQTFRSTTGKLDTSAVEQNGEYIVRIRVNGNPGFTSTDWSEGDSIKWTINNTDIKYTLSTDGTHGNGASTALTSGRWEYWLVTEEGSAFNDVAEYDNGTISFNFLRGWSWYGAQLFRHYSNYDAGTNLEVKMTIKAVGGSGNITVCGEVFTLEDGVAKEITVYILQPDNAGQTEISTTLTVCFGEVGKGQTPSDDSFTGYVNVQATISNISVVPFIPDPLEKVDATYTAADKENEVAAKIEITKDENEEEAVASYQVGFFKTATDTKPVITAYLEKDGTFSDLSVEDGAYYLRVRAVAATALNSDSEWSDVLNEEVYVVANGATVKDIVSGDKATEGASVADPGNWYLWTESADITTKSLTTLSETKEQIVAITYSGANAEQWYAVQLFYKNSGLTANSVYALSLKINSSIACAVTLNGTAFELAVGENEITAYYKEASGSASLALIFGITSDYGDYKAGPVAAGTFTVSEIKWEEYTDITTLETPSFTLGEDGLVTITDTNEAGVGGYELNFVLDGKDSIVTVANGETVNLSRFVSGEYTVKIRATAADVRYLASAWSEGIEFSHENEGGVVYDLTDEGAGSIPSDGTWYYWADQNWCESEVKVSEANYDNGTIAVSFTSTGACTYGLQIKYVNPDYVAGTTYKFDIVATADMEIKLAGGDGKTVSLKAGEKVTVEGLAESKIQLEVNIKDNLGGTITISNVEWTAVTADAE